MALGDASETHGVNGSVNIQVGCVEHVLSCSHAFEEVRLQAHEMYGISDFARVYFVALNDKVRSGQATLVGEIRTHNGRRQKYRVWMTPEILMEVCYSPRHGCVIGLYPKPTS